MAQIVIASNKTQPLTVNVENLSDGNYSTQNQVGNLRHTDNAVTAVKLETLSSDMTKVTVAAAGAVLDKAIESVETLSTDLSGHIDALDGSTVKKDEFDLAVSNKVTEKFDELNRGFQAQINECKNSVGTISVDYGAAEDKVIKKIVASTGITISVEGDTASIAAPSSSSSPSEDEINTIRGRLDTAESDIQTLANTVDKQEVGLSTVIPSMFDDLDLVWQEKIEPAVEVLSCVEKTEANANALSNACDVATKIRDENGKIRLSDPIVGSVYHKTFGEDNKYGEMSLLSSKINFRVVDNDFNSVLDDEGKEQHVSLENLIKAIAGSSSGGGGGELPDDWNTISSELSGLIYESIYGSFAEQINIYDSSIAKINSELWLTIGGALEQDPIDPVTGLPLDEESTSDEFIKISKIQLLQSNVRSLYQAKDEIDGNILQLSGNVDLLLNTIGVDVNALNAAINEIKDLSTGLQNYIELQQNVDPRLNSLETNEITTNARLDDLEAKTNDLSDNILPRIDGQLTTLENLVGSITNILNNLGLDAIRDSIQQLAERVNGFDSRITAIENEISAAVYVLEHNGEMPSEETNNN